MQTFTQTPYVKAPGGIQIDVGFDLDQQQAKEQIALSQEELGKLALDLAKQPGFEYIADLDAQGAINWQAVALIQDYWEYENEGLTVGAAMLISLAVAAAIGAGAGGLFGGAGLGGVTAGAIGAPYTGLSAELSGLHTQAAVGLVANLGLAFNCALDCRL